METLIGWLILIVLIGVVVLWVIPGIITALIVIAYLVWMFAVAIMDIHNSRKRMNELRNKIRRD